MSLPLKTTPKSICIIRLSAIGDVTHMVPIIHTLQATWPDCKITWIIGKLEASLVADLPNVEFIIFDKTKGLSEYRDLRKRLGSRHFDILLHMQVALRASLISMLVNAPIRLGFDKKRAHDYQWLFTKQRIQAHPAQHVLDCFFEFPKKLGIEKKMLHWDIPIPKEAEAFAKQQLNGQQPVLAINPCSSNRLRNWRNWSIEKYATIIEHAIEKHAMQIVLTGGPAENELKFAHNICSLAEHPITNLVGKTSLKEMLAILKYSTILIAPDTGPAHIATTVGTPVIGLYASSNPQRTGPYLSQQYAVNRYPEALKLYNNKTIDTAHWGERVRSPEAMDLIKTDDVITMLNKVLKEHA